MKIQIQREKRVMYNFYISDDEYSVSMGFNFIKCILSDTALFI